MKGEDAPITDFNVNKLARLARRPGPGGNGELVKLLENPKTQASATAVRSYVQQHRDAFSESQLKLLDAFLAVHVPPEGSAQGQAAIGWQAHGKAGVDPGLLQAFTDPLLGGLFRSMSELRAQPSPEAALEHFNPDRFAAWLAALAWLDAIPVGEFKPTRQLLDQLHQVLSSFHDPQFWNPLHLLPKGTSRFHGGAPRWYPTLQLQNRHKDQPLTDAELATMRSIPNAPGYIELPWSRHDHRRVLHHYKGFGFKVRRDLEKLQRWYDDNDGKMDPVQLAAEWSQRFVCIHGYDDSVGKMARLIANRILNEHGLPPALLEKDDELAVKSDALTQDYREGIERYRQLAAQRP